MGGITWNKFVKGTKGRREWGEGREGGQAGWAELI